MDKLLANLGELSFGYALLDQLLNIKQINTKFSCILQKEQHEVLNNNITTFLPEMKIFTFNKAHEFQHISRSNGQTLSLDLFRIKLTNKYNYIVFCRDRTKYQQLSEQVKQINEQVVLSNEMFNVIYDGLFITDNNGVTIYVNDAFLNLSGLKRENVIGKSVYYLMEHNIVPNSCTAVVLRTKAPAAIINDYYQGKSCLVSGNPVFIDGQLKRVVCVIRDVTELNCLKSKLENVTSLTLSYKHQLKEIEVKIKNKGIINTRSKIMKDIYDKAIKVAEVDSPLLLLGETGVGKDFLASFIHDLSERSNDGHFIKVNCGAIPENLLESELFGYEQGAFTGANKNGKAGLFELANNGTLFLDEIGDIPLQLQVKLLTALQDKTIYRVGGTKTIKLQARVIAATNVDLEKHIKEGKFRRDLYYRLNVITIRIPSLRERRDDIMPLAMSFLEQFNMQYHKNRYFAPKIIELFLSYDWPGNIREMKNTIERLVIFSEEDCIESRAFEDHIVNGINYTDSMDYININPKIETGSMCLKERLEHFEASCIREAIEYFASLKEAAEALEIDLSTLVRKKQKYDIYKKKL